MQRRWALLAVTIALTASACGGSSAAKGAGARQKPLAIAGKGFTQLAPNPIGVSQITYAVVVENPNTRNAVVANLTVTFLDAAGTVVQTDAPKLAFVLAGQQAAYGATVKGHGAVKMNVEVAVDGWTRLEPAGALTVSDVSMQPPRTGSGFRVVGKVASTYKSEMKLPLAASVIRNDGGAIVGGSHTLIPAIPAGGSTAFEIPSLDAIPGATAADVLITLNPPTSSEG
ncbi:MAG: hypothetical protein U0V73_16450 [Acidimicrobiia bacterium]